MSKMKVKPTHKMVECLKKVLTGCQVDLVNLTPQEFRYFVDIDDYDHEVDYDWKTSLFKVIRIVYPSEDYACDKYLTTKDLSYCLKHSDKTFNGFMEEVKAFCAI